MKRILQVIGGLDIGGAETFILNIFKNINHKDYEFYFLVFGNKKFDYEEDILKLGGKIIRIDNPVKFRYLRHINQIQKVIKQYNIDIVHAHTLLNSCFSIIAAKKCGIEVRIVHSHSTKNNEKSGVVDKIYYKIAKRIINKNLTHAIACGEEAGKFLFTVPFDIVNNGIEVEKFKYNENIRNKIRSNLEIKNEEKLIMHVGRFQEAKNHQFLIEIFKKYLNINKKSKLLLFGQGELENSIRLKVKELDIGDKVIFGGIRKDVNEYYNAADIFVFPSLFEGLPVVLMETQANNLVSLVSDKIDSNVKITDSVEFSSINQDAEEWAKKMEELMYKHDRGLDTKKLEELDILNSVKKLDKIYSKS